MDLWQVQYVFDAVLSILWVEGSLAEETNVSLGPHLMVLVFVLVDSVPGFILLQDLIETRSFDIVALSYCILAVIQKVLWLLLFLKEFLVLIELHDKRFACTCVKYVNHTGLDHLVQAD